MTSSLIQASRDIIGGDEKLGDRVDLVVIALLAFLLVEYDLLRVYYFSRAPAVRLKPFGLALAPLGVAFAIVIASRWSEIR